MADRFLFLSQSFPSSSILAAFCSNAQSGNKHLNPNFKKRPRVTEVGVTVPYKPTLPPRSQSLRRFLLISFQALGLVRCIDNR